MFSSRYEAALSLAARRHNGQRRKGGDLPYLTHLVHVGRMLEPYGEDAVIAGLLHDLLEDTCDSMEELRDLSRSIEASFGRQILDAIEAVSEPKLTEEGSRIPWRTRKEHYIEHLLKAPELALLVSAADKIHNVATLVLEIDETGPAIWERFRASADESLWFYRGVLGSITKRLGTDHPFAVELASHIEALSHRI